MNAVFEYSLIVYDEIEKEEEVVNGIAFGNSFTDAMASIERYYEDMIVEITYLRLADSQEEGPAPIYELGTGGTTLYGRFTTTVRKDDE